MSNKQLCVVATLENSLYYCLKTIQRMYSQIHSAMTFTNNTSAQMSVNCWHYPSQENVHNSSSVISVYVFLWRIQMKCEKNSFKSYSSPSFISQGLSSASEKNFFKCYLWITALTYSAFTQGLGIRIQFSSLPYLISWFFSSSSLEYAYFAIKLNISVWTSPTSLAPTLASIWQDICGLLFCVFLAIMCCII